MLNLKKIGLGLGIVACLTTSGFSEELKLDQNFCKAYNYSTYNYLVDEAYSTSTGQKFMIEQVSTKNASDTKYTAKYGALSTDFLKESGIGYSVNMNWGNITLSFNEYMKYAHSAEDKKDLRKFSLILNYFQEWKKKHVDVGEYSFRDCIYLHTKILYSERLAGEISDNVGARKFTDYFAEATGTQKKLLSPFVKYIVNKDYERAKQYIKSVNAKYGMNKIYSEFENACDK